MTGGAIITHGDTATFGDGQFCLCIDKPSGSPTTVILPHHPVPWVCYTVKDGKGDSVDNIITVQATNALIDGLPQHRLEHFGHQSQDFMFNGRYWMVV